MRLLNTKVSDTGNFEIKEFRDDEIPPYAILSHAWDEEEVTFQDMQGTRAPNKKGYEKVKRCCSVARASEFEYVWVDTCCSIQTHHRRQCPTKRVAYAAENGGLWYLAFKYQTS